MTAAHYHSILLPDTEAPTKGRLYEYQTLSG